MYDNYEKNKVGNLKIFFGYAAGVGKTYSMLKAAHKMKSLGIDVVAGYIEPHLREETSNLIKGLEVLPTKEIFKNGVLLKEFDLDAATKRNPQLILVDELAHTNATGLRNFKRYQDIEELLNLGIDVYTTVNVQHIESLNDIIRKITGITVNERIPDKIFDNANQIELIDIEPNELINRINSGKVYKKIQVKLALSNFFNRDNLVCLREIALRKAADQINYRTELEKASSLNSLLSVNEKILVCLSSSPHNAKVIRTASRLAQAFKGNFIGLFIETSSTKELIPENIAKLRMNVQLATELGAKITTIYGDDIPELIAEYSKTSGITKIVLGRSATKKTFLKSQSFSEKITELAPDLDIYIIPNSTKIKNQFLPHTKLKFNFILKDFTITTITLSITTLLSLFLFNLGIGVENIITIYILGVLFNSTLTTSNLYNVVSSLSSVMLFNFFFIVPRFTFEAYDSTYPITFLVMFLSSFLTSTLTKRVRIQAKENALKAKNTEVLLETIQNLQRAENLTEIYESMAKQLEKLLNCTVVIYPVEDDSLSSGKVYNLKTCNIDKYLNKTELGVASWVLKNNKSAGKFTNTLSNSTCLYYSARGTNGIYSIIGLDIDENLEVFQKNLLIAMISEFGLILEKIHLTKIKNEIYLESEREQQRSTILRAISHDLRTPLTGISGNSSILMNEDISLSKEKRLQLCTDIYDDSIWLINLVENLLSITKIEDNSLNIKMEPDLINDVIFEALKHISRQKIHYDITTDTEDELLLAKMDARLIIQVIINIVDNAIKYTPPGSKIKISSKKLDKLILIEISDNGPGVLDDSKSKLFDPFFTNDSKGDSRRGLGLGLALCKSIITFHGGTISVRDNIPTGTIFSFTLQSEEICYE